MERNCYINNIARLYILQYKFFLNFYIKFSKRKKKAFEALIKLFFIACYKEVLLKYLLYESVRQP